MTKKTAVAERQPDLLGEPASPPKNAVAKVEHSTKPAKSSGRPGDLLNVLHAVIQNPNVPVEKVQAIMDMQEKAEREAARRAFTAAKLALRPNLPVVNKDGKIEIEGKQRADGRSTRKQSTPYATFENIMKHIDRPLQAHGFDLWYETAPTDDGSRIVVIGHLDHVDGHGVTTKFPLPAETSGSKNNVQGWMSTFSYGKRGCTIALLNIRTQAPEDADRDGHPPPEIEAEALTETQVTELRKVIKDSGLTEVRFCEVYSIEKIDDLPPGMLAKATKACRDYKAKMK